MPVWSRDHDERRAGEPNGEAPEGQTSAAYEEAPGGGQAQASGRRGGEEKAAAMGRESGERGDLLAELISSTIGDIVLNVEPPAGEVRRRPDELGAAEGAGASGVGALEGGAGS